MDEARKFGYHLRREEPLLILNEMLKEKMGLLQKAEGSDLTGQAERIEEIITLLDRVEKWGFEISKDEAQDLMDEILKEYVGGLRRVGGEMAVKSLFPRNLILLGRKVGFQCGEVFEDDQSG